MTHPLCLAKLLFHLFLGFAAGVRVLKDVQEIRREEELDELSRFFQTQLKPLQEKVFDFSHRPCRRSHNDFGPFPVFLSCLFPRQTENLQQKAGH